MGQNFICNVFATRRCHRCFSSARSVLSLKWKRNANECYVSPRAVGERGCVSAPSACSLGALTRPRSPTARGETMTNSHRPVAASASSHYVLVCLDPERGRLALFPEEVAPCFDQSPSTLHRSCG